MTDNEQKAILCVAAVMKNDKWPSLENWRNWEPEIALVVRGDDMVNGIDMKKVSIDTRSECIVISENDAKIRIPMYIHKDAILQKTSFVFPINEIGGYAHHILTGLFIKSNIDGSVVYLKEVKQYLEENTNESL